MKYKLGLKRSRAEIYSIINQFLIFKFSKYTPIVSLILSIPFPSPFARLFIFLCELVIPFATRVLVFILALRSGRRWLVAVVTAACNHARCWAGRHWNCLQWLLLQGSSNWNWLFIWWWHDGQKWLGFDRMSGRPVKGSTSNRPTSAINRYSSGITAVQFGVFCGAWVNSSFLS